MTEKLGEKLKYYRQGSNMTQQEVADALNIDRSTYSCYEIGKTEPNIQTLAKLTQIFKVSYAELLSEDKNFSSVADPILANDEEVFVNKLTKFEKEVINKLRLMPLAQRYKFMYELSLKEESISKSTEQK